MKYSSFAILALCVVSKWGVAGDIDISIDGAASPVRYELQSLQIGTSGVIDLRVTSIVAAPLYPQTYTLTLSAGANGTIVLPDDSAPATSYVCSDASTCVPDRAVTLKAKPASSDYRLKAWGGACVGNTETCSLTMSANRAVTAEFELVSSTPPTQGAACNPVGSTLVDVGTQIPGKSFPRTDYQNVVTPSSVYAFAFKTKDTAEVATGVLTAAQLSNTIDNKWIVVSECRGDIERANKDAGCARYATESTVLAYVLNKGGAYKPSLYCNLKPNTQYYANVVAPGKVTGLAENTCKSTANCGFSFTGN